MNERNLPIKMIMPRVVDNVKNLPGGSGKEFCEVNQDLQTEIMGKFSELLDYYSDEFDKDNRLPVIGRVILREEAIAKSHRPNDLLKHCPIVGVGNLDELYIKVSKEGIQRTVKDINDLKSKKIRENLTTIIDVKPLKPEEKISEEIEEIIEKDKVKDIVNRIKVKLFRFEDEFDDAKIHEYFSDKLDDIGLGEKTRIIKYGDSIEYFKIEISSEQDIINLSKINGVKEIDFFQEYSADEDNFSQVSESIELKDSVPTSDVIIGIIDSGISDENPYLAPYIYDRVVYVPEMYQNRSHGTFVASTIQYGDELNGIQAPDRRFSFLDVVAIPNSDKKHGPVGSLSEDDFQDMLIEVMEEYADVVKIWNLSLGQDRKCSNKISDLAIFLDYLQDKYDVQFIIACGNIDKLPLQTWPVSGLGEHDRMTTPADSVRSISVGSLAYYDSDISLVKKDEPSPFSRRGPGANFIVKPEMVDYGGNYDSKFSVVNHGMKGMDVNGNIVEGVGTSYSTPRIVKKFANVYDNLIDKDLLMAKALAIHSARMNFRNIVGEGTENIKSYGFGMPSHNVDDILMCTRNEVTLIFKQTVTPTMHLELEPFPYPDSLIRNGKYKGEIGMTLLYKPILDSKFGQEYCRTNVEVSFGTYEYKEEKIKFKGQVPMERTWDGKYEVSRVKSGFKWSPAKSHYRNLVNGIGTKDGWRLRVNLQGRSNLLLQPQEFILLVTIKDHEDNNIYSELVRNLQNMGYITNNLQVKQIVRERN